MLNKPFILKAIPFRSGTVIFLLLTVISIFGLMVCSGCGVKNDKVLDEGIIECVVEVSGSHKIGKCMPGTLIPVLGEEKLYRDQPEYAMILSWHIADEIAPKLRKNGFKGKFIVPLPAPIIIE